MAIVFNVSATIAQESGSGESKSVSSPPWSFDRSPIESYTIENYFSSYEKDSSRIEKPDFFYADTNVQEVKTVKLEKEDILNAVPSISTGDKKTLGLLIPPFAYFAKKF